VCVQRRNAGPVQVGFDLGLGDLLHQLGATNGGAELLGAGFEVGDAAVAETGTTPVVEKLVAELVKGDVTSRGPVMQEVVADDFLKVLGDPGSGEGFEGEAGVVPLAIGESEGVLPAVRMGDSEAGRVGLRGFLGRESLLDALSNSSGQRPRYAHERDKG